MTATTTTTPRTQTGVLVEKVVRRFGDRVVLDHLDLTIDDDELVVLLGPSGCGKSTLQLRARPRAVSAEERGHDTQGRRAGLPQPGRGRLCIQLRQPCPQAFATQSRGCAAAVTGVCACRRRPGGCGLVQRRPEWSQYTFTIGDNGGDGTVEGHGVFDDAPYKVKFARFDYGRRRSRPPHPAISTSATSVTSRRSPGPQSNSASRSSPSSAAPTRRRPPRISSCRGLRPGLKGKKLPRRAAPRTASRC